MTWDAILLLCCCVLLLCQHIFVWKILSHEFADFDSKSCSILDSFAACDGELEISKEEYDQKGFGFGTIRDGRIYVYSPDLFWERNKNALGKYWGHFGFCVWAGYGVLLGVAQIIEQRSSHTSVSGFVYCFIYVCALFGLYEMVSAWEKCRKKERDARRRFDLGIAKIEEEKRNGTA